MLFLHTKDVIRDPLMVWGVKFGEDIRKQSVPSTNSRVALATKKGPAAPVTQSPQRSTRLKQAKTKWGRGQGMTRVVVTGVKNCCNLARSTLDLIFESVMGEAGCGIAALPFSPVTLVNARRARIAWEGALRGDRSSERIKGLFASLSGLLVFVGPMIHRFSCGARMAPRVAQAGTTRPWPSAPSSVEVSFGFGYR